VVVGGQRLLGCNLRESKELPRSRGIVTFSEACKSRMLREKGSEKGGHRSLNLEGFARPPEIRALSHTLC
jgi:hypothetical protein